MDGTCGELLVPNVCGCGRDGWAPSVGGRMRGQWVGTGARGRGRGRDHCSPSCLQNGLVLGSRLDLVQGLGYTQISVLR